MGYTEDSPFFQAKIAKKFGWTSFKILLLQIKHNWALILAFHDFYCLDNRKHEENENFRR